MLRAHGVSALVFDFGGNYTPPRGAVGGATEPLDKDVQNAWLPHQGTHNQEKVQEDRASLLMKIPRYLGCKAVGNLVRPFTFPASIKAADNLISVCQTSDWTDSILQHC